MGDPGPRNQIVIDELLSSLPACRRCRLNKRRCDTQLPSCRNCSNAGSPCVFFDHVLKKDLSRSYIASLLRSLREIQQSGDENHSITYSHQNMRSNDVALTRKGDSHLKTCRYIGKLACLAQSQPIANEDFPNAECIQPLARPPILEVQPGIIINEEIRHYLLQVYLTRIHCLYPFLNESMPPLAQTSLLTGDLDPWQKFILELIYAIACYGVDQDGYRTLAQDCHNRVLPNIDNATADITIYSLQAIPLLALHSLLEPQKGNAWQLIGFAGRLAMDLERHGSQNQETMMDRIYPSIYCIENQLATALDRPCFLPEPDRPLHFDTRHPANFICSLYRIQSRFRNVHRDVASLLQRSVPVGNPDWRRDAERFLNPNALAVAYETHLLIDPKPATAARLLSMYARADYIYTFLTAQWAYKAAMIALTRDDSLSSLPDADLMQAYGDCLLVLERASRRWSGASLLKESVQSCLKIRKRDQELVATFPI